MGKWKGVRLNLMKNPEAPLELYDLATDLGETSNVAADHPEVVATIQNAMETSHVDSPEFKLFGKTRK
jgi:arylsulfatase A